MNKCWKNIGNNKYGKSCYALYFTPFDEDENDDNILAIVVQDNKIPEYYNYVSREMNVEDDDLMAENIEDAKIQIEEKLIEFWEDEIAEIEDKIEKFKEGYNMVLKDKYNNKSYYCKLTEDLDHCAGFNIREYPYYKHYLLDYRHTDGFYNLPIRVPSGTVGGIWVDEHNVIVNIKIDRNYVVKTYSDELDAIIEKYIGKKIEFER